MPNLSDIQNALLAASTQGPAALHAAMFQKLASLNLNAEDREAVLSMLVTEQDKTAEISPSVMRSLALGTMLSGPALNVVREMRASNQKEEGWQGLVGRASDLHAQDPERLRAVYDLVHSSAPTVAQNPVIMADVARQMMSMPLVDLGTVGRLATTGRDLASSSGDGPEGFHKSLEQLPSRMKAVQLLTAGKMAELGVPVVCRDSDGNPCALNWGTTAMKTAGITDAVAPSSSVYGSGDPLSQANAGTAMSQNTLGTNYLPLDAVVRELMMKEQELSQREEAIQQAEMAMQQAQAQYGAMGQQYQDTTGVDPATGAPIQQPADAGTAGTSGATDQAQGTPAQDQAAADVPTPDAAAATDAGVPAPEQAGAPTPLQGQEPDVQAPEQAASVPSQGQEPGVSDQGSMAEDPAAGTAGAATPVEDAAPTASDAAADATSQGAEPPADAGTGEEPVAAAPTAPTEPVPPMTGEAAPPAPAPVDASAALGNALGGGLTISVPLPALQLTIKAASQDPAMTQANSLLSTLAF